MTNLRRRLLAGGAVVAVLACAGAGLAAASPAAAAHPTPAQRAAATSAVCPAPNYPHRGDDRPYLLRFSGRMAGSISILGTPVGTVSLPNLAGSFCGLLSLPAEQATVQPANLAVSPVKVRIARAIVPSSFAATAASVGTVSTVVAPDGGLNLDLSVPIRADTGLFGVSCLIPTRLDLSTANEGGQSLTGPLAAAHAVATQAGFSLGAAESTGAGGTCPGYLASQVDSLLGLPTDRTSATVDLSLDVQIP